jgi:type III pantothenate kinase
VVAAGGGSPLLAVDIGNTNTVLGLWRGDRLARHWRLTTRRDATSDEIALSVRGLFAAGPEPEPLEPMRVIVASVVPSLRFPMRQALRQILEREPLFVEPGVKTGMPILYDVPQEVGADRIVNAVAAHERLGGPCIVVDFGTATTFDVVTAKGEYAGGVIVPGIQISAEALFEKAARLWRVEIRRPDRVDGMIDRIAAEIGAKPRVIATGGLAELFGGGSERIGETDPLLTLKGLRIIDERNRGG